MMTSFLCTQMQVTDRAATSWPAAFIFRSMLHQHMRQNGCYGTARALPTGLDQHHDCAQGSYCVA